MTNNSSFSVSNLFSVEGEFDESEDEEFISDFGHLYLGWVVVVTGGGTGIGLMTAQTFANNGARVYITSRRQSVLNQAVDAHGKSLIHPKGALIPMIADVTSKSSIEQLFAEIGKREKHIDVLVNSAGITGSTTEADQTGDDAVTLSKALWGEDIADWEDVYRTNVVGSFLMTARFLPLLAASAEAKVAQGGVVVNISSTSAISHKTVVELKYAVSKAALGHLSSLLAQECRRSKINVRVNNVVPGLFPTEMTTQCSDGANKSSLPPTDEFLGEKVGIPAGRPGRDEEMAQAILALACNQSAYDSSFVLDGGYLLENP